MLIDGKFSNKSIHSDKDMPTKLMNSNSNYLQMNNNK